MSKRKVKKINLNKILIIVSVIFILISCVLLGLLGKKKFSKNNQTKKTEVTSKVDLETVKQSFFETVKTKEGASLYKLENNEYKEVATIHGSIELTLDATYNIVDEYFKIKESDFYVKYDEVEKIANLTKKVYEYKYYKNYIPYNQNIVLKNKAKLYTATDNYYEVKEGSYPIIIKDDDKYGIEYNNSLVYVNKNDVQEIVDATNTSAPHTDGLSVLNYHYTVSATDENGERTECQQTICITDTMFDTHIKYLVDNGYYGASIRDLELFIDGKIQLPEKSVVITIDDGWYVARSITILEKYKILGTLFLIGSLASPNDYTSDYLEVHSHTWNMHKLGDCPTSVGRGGILCLDENTILEDLQKSRESLNNTTYFCYPFYDYNDRAIELLKKAGFTMAFAGELKDSTVRVGQDKFKIPRYVIVNYTTMDEFIKYVS